MTGFARSLYCHCGCGEQAGWDAISLLKGPWDLRVEDL